MRRTCSPQLGKNLKGSKEMTAFSNSYHHHPHINTIAPPSLPHQQSPNLPNRKGKALRCVPQTFSRSEWVRELNLHVPGTNTARKSREILRCLLLTVGGFLSRNSLSSGGSVVVIGAPLEAIYSGESTAHAIESLMLRL